MIGDGSYHRVVRPLPGEVAQSGGREDRVRRDGDGRHARQRAHDDAREEQRRHRQVHRQLAEQERAARPRREHVEGDAAARRSRRSPTDDIARKGFFYAGGEYWGEPGRQVMRGAMYTEVWVPRQIRHPNPIVLFHGNGQTGVDWQQTPDGRAGWAYTLDRRRLRRLHGGLPGARPLRVRAAARARRQDADRRQPRHPHRRSSSSGSGPTRASAATSR